MTALTSMLRTTGDHAREFVRLETQRWTRFVRARALRAASGTRSLFAPRAIERRFLAGASGTLRALDGKLGARLADLDAAPRTPRAARATSKRSKRKAPLPTASGPALIAGGRKAG